MSKKYFEAKFQGPYKGVNVSVPSDMLGNDESPFIQNFILKNSEIRTRPRCINNIIPGTPDGNPILILTSFLDSNTVFHTVAVTQTGLYQLNRSWFKQAFRTAAKTWNLVGAYTSQPGPNFPAASSVFVNKFFWTNGGNNLYQWDGISAVGSPSLWKPLTSYIQGSRVIDSNGNVQIATNSGISKANPHPVWGNTLGAQTLDSGTTPITWIENGKPIAANGFSSIGVVDATNGITAGAYFLIELNSQLIMLSTLEGVGNSFQAFPQRVRWSASGIPTAWDSNLNIGAGFNDEIDVPDAITGAMTVGTTAFIYRNNGITEVTSTGNGINPFNFNHLWASDRGIGNVFPFGYASYGPLGIFIANDDIYNISMGGFKKIGNRARDAIFTDLISTTGIPIGSIVPYYAGNYIYNHYRLSIPIGKNNKTWIYSIEDDNWQLEAHTNKNFSGVTRWSYVT